MIILVDMHTNILKGDLSCSLIVINYTALCSTGAHKGIYKERKPTIDSVLQDFILKQKQIKKKNEALPNIPLVIFHVSDCV